MYKLHAGERVLNAGQATRTESGGSTFNIRSTFNITASVNNDIDIRDLARKLASLQETELRRRVSYL
jgi:hypothetical protein